MRRLALCRAPRAASWRRRCLALYALRRTGSGAGRPGRSPDEGAGRLRTEISPPSNGHRGKPPLSSSRLRPPMTFEPLPPVEDPESLPRARRRRAGRMLTQMRADERESYLEDLAHQVSPGIDLYLFAALSGLLIGVGFRFDPLALFVAAVLIAPRLGPLAGMALAAVCGSLRYFGRQLGALLLAGLLAAFVAGVGGGGGGPGD